jgi:hypothetical protein
VGAKPNDWSLYNTELQDNFYPAWVTEKLRGLMYFKRKVKAKVSSVITLP